MHAVLYVVVNSLFVFAWLMTTGTRAELDAYIETPADAVTTSFWPIVPIVVWGAALVIHATAVLLSATPGSRRRRKRKRRTEARRSADRATRHAAQAQPAPSGPHQERHRDWVVVMFTDISRSTPLTEVMGDDAWVEVLAAHRDAVRRQVTRHEGTEVGTQGDGFLVRFGDPGTAVECAVHLQRDLEDGRSSGAFTPEVRVGIHAGEAIHEEDDLVGQVVNLASRVVDVAGPSEILVTEPVADHLPAMQPVIDGGLHELRGHSHPRHLFRVVWRADEAATIIRERDA